MLCIAMIVIGFVFRDRISAFLRPPTTAPTEVIIPTDTLQPLEPTVVEPTEALPPTDTVMPIDTETPEGLFRIQVKQPSRHMGDGRLTADINAYELPGVPWVSYFFKTGVAFHGTYWHDNFGRKMSHGCVNMRTAEAKWLYRWTMPSAGAKDWNVKGLGTQVLVT